MKRLAWGLAGVALLSASTGEAAIVLDGQLDAGYGSAMATDPSGDLASPGPADWSGVAWTDLTALHVINDGTDLYIHVPSASFASGSSAGSFGVAIDVNGSAAGGSNDPWGNAITFAQTAKPDFVVRGNTPNDGGWTELRSWDGSDFDNGGGDNIAASAVAWSDGNGLELKLSLATLGLDIGDTVNLFVFAGQTGGAKGAYDTVPSDDQSNGWDDATSHTAYGVYTIVPEPTSLALAALGLPLMLRRRR